MEKKKTCFVICPIGKPNTEIRERSDAILNYIISPVVENFGYEALRADKISESGMITNQVIEHLLEDPLVVADLTDNNANVYYELAIRHVVKKPVVHIIEYGQTPPFDTKDIRAVPVASKDLKIAEEAKKQISEHIKALEKTPTKIVTPISMTIDLKHIRESSKGEDQNTSLILNQLANISARLSSVEKEVSSGLKTDYSSYQDAFRNLQEKQVEMNKMAAEMNKIAEVKRSEEKEDIVLKRILKDLRKKGLVKD